MTVVVFDVEDLKMVTVTGMVGMQLASVRVSEASRRCSRRRCDFDVAALKCLKSANCHRSGEYPGFFQFTHWQKACFKMSMGYEHHCRKPTP